MATDIDMLIKAFVKTLEEATTNRTQFKCSAPQGIMDSYDVEPGTVVVVDNGWEAMRIVGNGDKDEKVWVRYDGRTYTHEEFAQIARDSARVVHEGII